MGENSMVVNFLFEKKLSNPSNLLYLQDRKYMSHDKHDILCFFYAFFNGKLPLS